jgi:hypothetical protein
MRIKMLRGVGWENGQSLDPGTEHDIPDYWAKQFIAQGRAVRVEAVEAREPDVEHRDPAPARKRGARGR